MTGPQRIQIKRQPGFRLQAASLALNGLPAVVVTRPGPFGNPFPVDVYGRENAIALCRVWLETETAEELGYSGSTTAVLNARRAEIMRLLPDLRGKNLACWCGLDQPCHADILLDLTAR